jgi:hypothetical protein
VHLERLAHLDAIGDAQPLDGDLAWNRTAVRHGEELHAELLRAGRLGQQIAVRLDAVGVDDRVTQVPGRKEPVRELHGGLEVRAGAEMRRRVGVVAGEGRGLFGRVRHFDEVRPARERHDARDVVALFRGERGVDRTLGVVNRLGRHRIGDVDQEDRAHLFGPLGARDARERQRQHGDERHAEPERQELLLPGKVRERARQDEEQDGGHEQHADELRRAQHVRRAAADPRERRVGRAPDELAIKDDEQGRERRREDAERDAPRARAHTVILRW